MSYDYRVTFVTDYLVITTNVCLEIDDTVGNLSDEAYEQATINGINNIVDEIGYLDETIIKDITVTLLLDDEEIELGGECEGEGDDVDTVSWSSSNPTGEVASND